MKTEQKICIHTSVFVSFLLRFHPSTLNKMRFWKRSSKREQDTFVTSAKTMVTFVLCCHKYCFKRLKFTSFFNLVTRFLFNLCFESGVEVLAGKHALSWRQRFWKAPFSCNYIIKTYGCVFKCLRTQKRFQMSPFPKTRASVFDRCSVVARWKRIVRIENDAFSNENVF